ncbi:MAG TPA: YceI family protein, partial [Planctomycetota bacterium]|nr:YceI family protein [Planctomycetota bacterium]
ATKASPTPAFSPAEAGTYAIDNVHSTVLFRAKHMDVSYSYGRFNELSGQFVLSPEEGKSSLQIKVVANSVDTNSKKRDDHLRSPDFFNVKQFPEIRFESTKFEKKDDTTYAVTGKLSFHGETKEVTVDMDFTGARDGGPQMGFRGGLETQLEIKRRDYGMDTYPDDMISNDIRLTIALEGVRK